MTTELVSPKILGQSSHSVLLAGAAGGPEEASAPNCGKRNGIVLRASGRTLRQSYSLRPFESNGRCPNLVELPIGNVGDISVPENCPQPKVTNFTVDPGYRPSL